MVDPLRQGMLIARRTRRLRRFVGTALLMLVPAAAWAQTSDTKPPSLEGFSFAPTAVDVSAGQQLVAVSAHVTDDLSGTASVIAFFRSPTGVQQLQIGLGRASGNGLDGIYTGNLVVPQFSEIGTWTVLSVQVVDATGNFSSVATSVLASRDFTTQLLVVSSQDTQPPVVAAIAATPTSIDVSASDQTVTIDIMATDDASGAAFSPCTQNQNFNFFAVTLRSPSGAQNRYLAPFPFALLSGTRQNGVWRSSFVMPRNSEGGIWRISSVDFHDCAGNRRFMNEAAINAAGLQISLNVNSPTPDVQGPVLKNLTLIPININTSSGNQTVKVRIEASDNLSGVQFSPTTPQLSFAEVGIELQSQSGVQRRAAFAFTPFTLVSGTALDGVWESNLQFPQFSEQGIWTVDYFAIKDRVRNFTNFTAAQLKAAGFASTLEVIKPSLVTDGTVGTTGGEVSDQTFGDRASVIFPANALKQPTDVAIDVLDKPLDVPTPTGFTGPGTLYVNIHLTPEPTFPLAPPGLTVVLPLTNPMIAGTQLKLYRINPETGLPEAAISVFGKEVVGFVDADGLSATFQGISRLSTVVGFIPEAINVGVDIKPGESPNTINLKSRGVLPVAILSTSAFDARSVAPETVVLAGAHVRLKGNGDPAVSLEDVNGDGLLDLILQFDTQSLEITSSDAQANLTGRTTDGLKIIGHDEIKIVPK